MTIELNTVNCMDAIELLMSLEPQSADAVISDFPYGTTSASWDVMPDLPKLWDAIKHALKLQGVVVTTASQPFTSMLVMSNLKWFRYEWIWDKHMVSGVGSVKFQPLRSHESIIVFAPQSASEYHPQMTGDALEPFGRKSATTSGAIGNLGTDYQSGVGYPKTILKFPRPNNLTDGGLHQSQKPVALYEYLILTYTQPNALVVDPFAGSGTTGVAARNTNRRYILGDTSEGYVEVARKRLAQPFTVGMFTD